MTPYSISHVVLKRNLMGSILYHELGKCFNPHAFLFNGGFPCILESRFHIPHEVEPLEILKKWSKVLIETSDTL